MILTPPLKTEIKNGGYILLGAMALAIGVVLLLAPNRIATGGTPGMAILLNHLLDLPIGLLLIAINLPLLLAGAKLLGKAFALRSLVAIGVVSMFIDLLRELLKLPAISNEPLLASLFGGVAVGTGVGLILRGDATAGGSTLIARLVAARSHYKPGQVIFALDVLIIIVSGLVFRAVEPALWSLICIYATSRCINVILTGAPTDKVVHIVSDQVEVLGQQIAARLGPHGSVVTASGLVDGAPRRIIFVTVESRRITVLRDIIRQHDPKAFMVVMEATEMLGRGHGA